MGIASYMSGLALLATGNFNEAKPLLGAVVGVSIEGLPLDQEALRAIRKLCQVFLSNL